MNMFFPVDGSVAVFSKRVDTKCGHYEKGQELTNAQLFMCKGTYEFRVRRKILEPNAKELMRVAHTYRSTTGAVVYAARPYTSDVGQMKIYWCGRDKVLVRVVIKQIYTKTDHGQLSVRVDLRLIDSGDILYNQPLHFLYDFPQTSRYLSQLEPEVLNCALDLPDALLYDKQVGNCFMETIKKHKGEDKYIIVLRSYHRGRYYVDLLNAKRLSIIDHLKSQYINKFSPNGSEDSSETINSESSSSQESLTNLWPEMQVSQVKCRASVKAAQKTTYKHYNGVVHYFRCKLKHMGEVNYDKFTMMKQFHEVKLTIWEHPMDIYLIPRDPEYFKSHQSLLDDIKSYVKKYNIECQTDDSVFTAAFHVNETCLFRNNYVDEIGTWLRGVITEVPKVTKWCWIDLDQDMRDQALAGELNNEPTRSNRSNFFYRVRSIDYGFELTVSVGTLRKADDKTIFTRRGSYSLRCRLFGIHPLSYNYDADGKREFSDTCKLMVDAWMREKLVQEHRPSHFHALFHNSFTSIREDYQSEPVDITLFHRFEPLKTIDDIYLPLMRKKEIKYECLNTYLVESGYVTDENDKGTASRVELNHLLINLLANREYI